MTILLLIIFAYLIGSIQFGVVFVRLFGKGDIRHMGSGNTGATNVMRTQDNKWLGVLTFVCDFLKGYIVVLIAGNSYIPIEHTVFVGFAAFLGHIFPIFSNFNGGKGVSTSLGVFCGVTPFIGLLSVTIWILTFLISRTSAISGMSSILSAFLITLFYYNGFFTLKLLYGLIALLVIIKHRKNIKDICNGRCRSRKCMNGK